MAKHELRLETTDRTPQPLTNGTQAPLGDLIKRLATDTGELVKQEINLAKLEVREAGTVLAKDAAKIGVGAALALVGGLTLAAFLVIALGDLVLADNYWLSALIVGVIFLAIGGLLARGAITDMKKRGLKPRETIRTLRDDTAWAKREAREFKRELTS